MTKTTDQLDAIIRKYHVTIASGGRIHVIAPKGASEAEVAAVIRPNKQALMARIREVEAYLGLEDMACASNDRKASAGRRGIEAVRSGEKSPSEALNDAETEWTAAINELIWM